MPYPIVGRAPEPLLVEVAADVVARMVTTAGRLAAGEDPGRWLGLLVADARLLGNFCAGMTGPQRDDLAGRLWMLGAPA